MKCHAAQFHKLRADGSPATEAEHKSAVLKAAQRTAWASGVHARSQVKAQTSVEAELARIKEWQQSAERPAFNDPPDRLDALPRSAWVAALHRACMHFIFFFVFFAGVLTDFPERLCD